MGYARGLFHKIANLSKIFNFQIDFHFHSFYATAALHTAFKVGLVVNPS
jgi:hypothetical protein